MAMFLDGLNHTCLTENRQLKLMALSQMCSGCLLVFLKVHGSVHYCLLCIQAVSSLTSNGSFLASVVTVMQMTPNYTYLSVLIHQLKMIAYLYYKHVLIT